MEARKGAGTHLYGPGRSGEANLKNGSPALWASSRFGYPTPDVPSPLPPHVLSAAWVGMGVQSTCKEQAVPLLRFSFNPWEIAPLTPAPPHTDTVVSPWIPWDGGGAQREPSDSRASGCLAGIEVFSRGLGKEEMHFWGAMRLEPGGSWLNDLE